MSAPLRAGALAVLIAALVPAPAVAHQGDPNFRSQIQSLDPAVEGVEVSVLNFDDSLRLRNTGPETVTVLGYDDEPYVRISPDGTVEVNERSPAYFLNGDRYADAEVPAEADPEAAPAWREVGTSGQYDWHDHRAHYMGEGTPSQVTDEGERTKVFDYEIPLQVGEKAVAVNGELIWVGSDGGMPIAPFIALGAVALIAGGTVVLVRRRGDDDGEDREAW